MVNSLTVIQEARECLQTPFLHQGRTKGLGLDCIGLVITVAKVTGIDASGFVDRPYGTLGDGSSLQAGLKQYLHTIWLHETNPRLEFRPLLKNADILLLTWHRNATHVGFAAVGPYGWNIIHSFSGCEYVTEHRLDEKWLSFVRGVFRFKDVS